jgi:hypothetical protein
MRTHALLLGALTLAGAVLLPRATPAAPAATQATPREGGQAAFAAIAEVVAILDADPTTDWTTVSIERLRQHLIDMDDVVTRAAVEERRLEGGVELAVTGTGRTVDAIRRMLPAHAAELDGDEAYNAVATEIPGGIRLTVMAGSPDDARAVARIRALGLGGLLAVGSHHQPHHLAMARGTLDHGQHHQHH